MQDRAESNGDEEGEKAEADGDVGVFYHPLHKRGFRCCYGDQPRNSPWVTKWTQLQKLSLTIKLKLQAMLLLYSLKVWKLLGQLVIGRAYEW